MKKLELNELNLGNAEVLTREQLKKVLGGDGSGAIICNNGLNEYVCNAGDLYTCTIACDQVAQNLGTYCLGCAQFPGSSVPIIV